MNAATVIPEIAYTDERVIDQRKTAEAALAFRKSHRVIPEEIADEIGLSLSMVYLLEKGKRKWTAKTFADYVKAVEKFTPR